MVLPVLFYNNIRHSITDLISEYIFLNKLSLKIILIGSKKFICSIIKILFVPCLAQKYFVLKN